MMVAEHEEEFPRKISLLIQPITQKPNKFYNPKIIANEMHKHVYYLTNESGK